MAVTIAEMAGHVTETALKSPPQSTGHDRRNDRSHSPKYAASHGKDQDYRISIAGAQEKTALMRHAGQWMRPLGATPTTHIIKLPMGLVGNMQADMRTSVCNEWLCLKFMEARPARRQGPSRARRPPRRPGAPGCQSLPSSALPLVR